MTIFDANMILRYLLNDNEEMASEAEAHLQKDEVCVTVEIIAEVVYVLKGVYSLGRETICDTLKDFLGMLYCRDRDIVLAALDIYAEKIWILWIASCMLTIRLENMKLQHLTNNY